MKRHPALQPLSREHHHVLAHARAMRWALSGREGTPREALGLFLAFWKTKVEDHFLDEEAWLLPLVPTHEHAERLCVEHADIRALIVRNLTGFVNDEPDVDAVAALARALHDHVRWEERVLFPAIEESASPEHLEEAGRRLAPNRPESSG